MKDLYSIGEVANIMGISVQTLRYYSNIGLLNPAYTNPETGYRYYSGSQLHFIDRIKYLQKFGLNLYEIKTIIEKNDIKYLVSCLDKRKKEFQDEISKIEDIIDGIEWYKNYFTYVDGETLTDHSYCLHLEKRYLVAVAYIENESNEDFHVRLNKLKSSARFKDLKYLRQYSIILNYDSLIEGRLEREYLGMFIKEAPGFESENIIEIPDGDFFCFKARILSDGWNPYFAKLFFMGKKKPPIMLANEYEDNLYEYSRCVYEVQMLISNEIG